jgi:hypothetical protein
MKADGLFDNSVLYSSAEVHRVTRRRTILALDFWRLHTRWNVAAAHCTVDTNSDHTQTHCVKEQVLCWKSRKNRKIQLTSPTFLAIDICWVGNWQVLKASSAPPPFFLQCAVEWKVYRLPIICCGLTLQSTAVTICTTCLKIKSSCFLSHCQCVSCAPRSTERLFTWSLLTDIFLVIQTACLRWGRTFVNVVQ